MIGLAPGTKVFLACQPIDLRAGFDGLSAKVQQIIGADPFSGHVFIFRSKRGHYLKGLYWDGSGLCLFAKRLERGKFVWPPIVDGTLTLTPAQMALLIEAMDWERRETGERQRVKVPYDEGVANHIGPESCVGGREAEREALTGVRVGQPLSGVRLPHRSADALQSAEGNTSRRVNASAGRLRVVERPWHARTSLAREPRDLRFARRQPGGGPHGEGRGP
jgi:transposase